MARSHGMAARRISRRIVENGPKQIVLIMINVTPIIWKPKQCARDLGRTMKNTDEQSGPYKRGFYQGYSGDMDPNRSQLTGQDLTDFENGANAGGERREIEELGE